MPRVLTPHREHNGNVQTVLLGEFVYRISKSQYNDFITMLTSSGRSYSLFLNVLSFLDLTCYIVDISKYIVAKWLNDKFCVADAFNTIVNIQCA